MRKVSKNSKKGFSLAEVILVVAIIVILAAVFVINVSDIIRSTNEKSDAQSESLSEVKKTIGDNEASFAAYNF